MQGPEETFFAERIHYSAAPCGAALSQVGQRGTRRDSGRAGERVHLCKNRTFCCAAGGCPFWMTQMEDAVKSRSLKESMLVGDLSELIAESTEAAVK
jgi:hypothetical protein